MPATMPFSKHKGKHLGELDDNYVAWLAGRELHGPLKEAVDQECVKRFGAVPPQSPNGATTDERPRANASAGDGEHHVLVASLIGVVTEWVFHNHGAHEGCCLTALLDDARAWKRRVRGRG
jgi:hypothetical protein